MQIADFANSNNQNSQNTTPDKFKLFIIVQKIRYETAVARRKKQEFCDL